MKIHLASLILSTLLFSFSCNSQQENKIGGPTFKATIDGELYEPKFVTGLVTKIINSISVSGEDGQGRQCQLLIPVGIEPGSYSFGTGASAQYTKNDDEGGQATEGDLVIKTHDKSTNSISGTFNFKAKSLVGNQTFNISDGVFDVIYTN